MSKQADEAVAAWYDNDAGDGRVHLTVPDLKALSRRIDALRAEDRDAVARDLRVADRIGNVTTDEAILIAAGTYEARGIPLPKGGDDAAPQA